MAIDDLPLPVVNLLNVTGVSWPYIDEGTLGEFTALTRDFATAVQTSHDGAARAVQGVAAAYQGSATDAMASGWAKLSARHVDEVLTACPVLADALDAAAGYVVAQKAEAILILIDMAAALIADQGAAIATAGIAEAAAPLIILGAEKPVSSLAADLEQYIIATVIEAAAKPLPAKIGDSLNGRGWSKSGARPDEANQFCIDPEPAALHAAALRQQAATIGEPGTVFALPLPARELVRVAATKIRALDF